MLKSPRSRIILAVAVIAVGALGGAGLFLLDDDDEGTAAVSTTTTTALELTTSTTAAADTTTTTAAGATTTTTRATTTTTRGSTTTSAGGSTTTTAAPAACGTGRATVAFVAKDLVTGALNSAFTPQAVVDNQVSEPIEVEQITVDVLYPGGEVRTVNFTTAGTVIGPGTSASFTAERLTTEKQYESARFTRFTYFSQNRPTTCRVTTP